MANEQPPTDANDLSRREFVTLSVAAGLAAAAGTPAGAQAKVVESDVQVKTQDGTCDAAFIHLTRLIAFKTPIPVTTGAGYAIQVNVAGAIPQSGGLGVWGGTVGDLYTGGSVMTGDCGGGSYWRVLSNFDLHFCTYVDPA